MMKLSDFDYDLPAELIAQHPAVDRAGSRMLVMDRSSGECGLRVFGDIVDYLREGDCLVFNDTKVIPARVLGRRKETGGRVEILFLEELSNDTWHCMMKPGRRLRSGQLVTIDGLDGEDVAIGERREDGTFEVKSVRKPLREIIQQAGSIPLPPYITRETTAADAERYQTVYARRAGAVAAPTAGLHFTEEILARLENKGVQRTAVTLHVGPGTFRPVKTENIEEHVMHEERYELSPDSANAINLTHARGGRVIAVGTTSVRVLESCVDSDTGNLVPRCGRTRLFMHPPAIPRITDGLLTNFHLPRSTLLMLVACFCSTEHLLAAYRLAVRERFRFYSYGDCMLLM